MNKFFAAAVVVVIVTSSIILPSFESEDNISANYLSKMFGDIGDGRENGSEFDDPKYRWFVDDRSSLTQDNDFFRSLELSDSFRTSGNDLFIELNEQNNQGRPVQNKIEIERGRQSSQLGVSKVRVLRSRNQVWMQIGRESALADILRNKKALDLTKEQIEMLDILLSDESERSKLSESEAQQRKEEDGFVMPKSNSENDSFTEPMDEVDLKDVSSTPVDTDGESIDPPASSREKIESSKSSDVESELLRLLIEDKMKEFEAFGQSPYPILYL